MFLPTSKQEMRTRGWDALDVILVSGDAYIDSPYIGTAVIGRVLEDAGFRVGIIAQPDIKGGSDITRLGEPELFWGVTAGSVDSMVANYTATKKHRRDDDYTPGGKNNRRPDRATIAYTNLIKRHFKGTRPIILGGIEASLRRIAHYDFWADKVRRSIVFDAKADMVVYGMAERAILDVAHAMQEMRSLPEDEDAPIQRVPTNIRGTCVNDREPREGYLTIPSFEVVSTDKDAFIEAFRTFYRNNDPVSAKGIVQQHGNRYLIQNPPAEYLSQDELDHIHSLPFELEAHPTHDRDGPIRALVTIGNSILTHRGCYGGCNFCAIAIHEGRTVRWRSESSVVEEAKRITEREDFHGYILDAGGPTANMYGFECRKKLESGACPDRECLTPRKCKHLPVEHGKQIGLLRKLRRVEGVKGVFVASGIRMDMVINDAGTGQNYLDEIVKHHVSGQLKVAPEHSNERVLQLMGKPDTTTLLEFKDRFDVITQRAGLPQFLTYYFIAAHPGCTEEAMHDLKQFTSKRLRTDPEQAQVFTPTPSTWSTVMYYTGKDPFTGRPLYVERDNERKTRQKDILTRKSGHHWRR